MKMIKKLVDMIDDELCSAKCYAEKYIEYKAKGDNTWANRFAKMANDELDHANYIHELAVKEIEGLKKVFVAPQGMQKKWDESHVNYVEKAAWVRQMLAM